MAKKIRYQKSYRRKKKSFKSMHKRNVKQYLKKKVEKLKLFCRDERRFHVFFLIICSVKVFVKEFFTGFCF